MYLAFVNAIGNRSCTFFTNTVFDVFQDAGMLFSFCIILFMVSVKILI